ncbi:cytochrome P450 86A8-like [Dioscorea cayenensis subsp. rotundata]|uniref:Cytochrome P450 86A8-like n=1 Tax=Dioscorea cayennensis subsp. rotundata TaxID=55577 RepID=A0AB40BK89_DIOCR|nr:cytochrome P450 86A8-like [Dioscorea cayenensis subsp. rotundata]
MEFSKKPLKDALWIQCSGRLRIDPICLSIEKEEEEEKKKIMSKKAKKAFGDTQRLTLVRAMDWYPYTSQTMKMLDIGDFDILSHFDLEKETNDEFRRDVLIGYALTGREMVSSALSWFFWLLSSAPEVEEKTLKEVEEVELRKGMVCVLKYICYGEVEGVVGEDCDVFRPKRWLEDGVFRPKSPFKYPIFHAGPRTCLRKDVACIQMKVVATIVLEGFKVEALVEKGRVPEHEFTLTLRMIDGLRVQVRRRE